MKLYIGEFDDTSVIIFEKREQFRFDEDPLFKYFNYINIY